MLKQKYNLRRKQQLAIIPLGDIHWGSPDTNYEWLEYWKKTIQKISSKKRIYLMGDLLECGTKKLANSAFEQGISLTDQMLDIIDFLEPLKEDIVFAANGNHELRLIKDFDLDLTKLISRQLGCECGNQYIDTFNINDKPISIYISHGAGSSKYHYTAEAKMIRDTQTIQADILLQGHNHRCQYWSIPLNTPEGVKRRHYGFTGSFLGYGGYADQKQLPLLPESFLYLGINKDHRVLSNIFYIDEVAPELMKKTWRIK